MSIYYQFIYKLACKIYATITYNEIRIFMDNNKLQNYEMIYSVERLSSFKQHEMDTKEDIIKSYCSNIKISQALYPELCTLEVILRNAIDST